MLAAWLIWGSASAWAGTIRPFTTDGCSAFPDGTPSQNDLWRHCCVAHDLAYWQGGERPARRRADEALAACVARVGQPEIAQLMMAGVRAGGHPWWPTRFRWGYGWPYGRGYQSVTAAEQRQVTEMLSRVPDTLPHGLERAKPPRVGARVLGAQP